MKHFIYITLFLTKKIVISISTSLFILLGSVAYGQCDEGKTVNDKLTPTGKDVYLLNRVKQEKYRGKRMLFSPSSYCFNNKPIDGFNLSTPLIDIPTTESLYKEKKWRFVKFYDKYKTHGRTFFQIHNMVGSVGGKRGMLYMLNDKLICGIPPKLSDNTYPQMLFDNGAKTNTQSIASTYWEMEEVPVKGVDDRPYYLLKNTLTGRYLGVNSLNNSGHFLPELVPSIALTEAHHWDIIPEKQLYDQKYSQALNAYRIEWASIKNRFKVDPTKVYRISKNKIDYIGSNKNFTTKCKLDEAVLCRIEEKIIGYNNSYAYYRNPKFSCEIKFLDNSIYNKGTVYAFNSEGNLVDNNNNVLIVEEVEDLVVNFIKQEKETNPVREITPIDFVKKGYTLEQIYGAKYEGGFIFHLETNSENNEWKAIIAAENNISGTWLPKNADSRFVNTDEKAFSGSNNTDQILCVYSDYLNEKSNLSNIASKARSYDGPNSTKNWSLPTISELLLMKKNLHWTKFDRGYYMSSSFSASAKAPQALNFTGNVVKPQLWPTYMNGRSRPVRYVGSSNPNLRESNSYVLKAKNKRLTYFLEKDGDYWKLMSSIGKLKAEYIQESSNNSISELYLKDKNSNNFISINYSYGSGKAQFDAGLLEFDVSVDLAWNKAINCQSPWSFLDALNTTYYNYYKEEALWNFALSSNLVGNYEYYLKNTIPETDHRYVVQAKKNIDSLQFAKAKHKGTPNAYRKYLTSHNYEKINADKANLAIQDYVYTIIIEIKSLSDCRAWEDEFSANGKALEIYGSFSEKGDTKIIRNELGMYSWSPAYNDRTTYNIPGIISVEHKNSYRFEEKTEQGTTIPKAFIVLRKTETQYARIVSNLYEDDDLNGDDNFESETEEILVSELKNDGTGTVLWSRLETDGTKLGNGGEFISVYYNFIKLDHEQLVTWNGFTGKCTDEFPILEVPHDLDGPGFIIRNETMYNLSISLQQLGPLYWETIKPGQIWYQGTGAVWFTIKTRINLTGQEEYTSFDAAAPILKEVGFLALDVTTGGAFAGFQGGLLAARAARTSGELLGTAVYLTGKKLLTDAATNAGMDALKTNLWSESYGYTSLGGCYAGYPLTTRKKEKMYRIVGGPKLPCYDIQNNRIQISPSEPLRIIEPD